MREVIRLTWYRLCKVKALSPVLEAVTVSYWVRVLIHFFDKTIFHKTWDESQTYFEQNRERIDQIKFRLADEKSRRIYSNLILLRATHDPKYMRGNADKNQYFDKDIIRLHDREIFVDCGAYDGDTIRAFLRKLMYDGGKFKEIVALEPDPQNYKKLNNWVSQLPRGGA